MSGRRAIERTLERQHERLAGGRVRLRLARWGHHRAAQLADGLLPRFGILRYRVRLQRVEGDAAGPIGRVVTFDAVVVEHFPVGLDRVGGRGRVRGQRGETECCRRNQGLAPHRATRRISFTCSHAPSYAVFRNTSGLPHCASNSRVGLESTS